MPAECALLAWVGRKGGKRISGREMYVFLDVGECWIDGCVLGLALWMELCGVLGMAVCDVGYGHLNCWCCVSLLSVSLCFRDNFIL